MNMELGQVGRNFCFEVFSRRCFPSLTLPTGVKMATSPPQKVDKYTLTLTLALESILLVTFRQEASNSSVKYLPSSDNKFLSGSNISEIICARLVGGKEFGGAVGYLIGCFKRFQLKETGSDDRLRQDLAACRKQVITFLASALIEPDAFGANSEDSLNDIYNHISTDVSGHIPPLLRELADELDAQDGLQSFTSSLILKAFEALNKKSQPDPSLMRGPPMLSVLDSHETTINLISLVCKSDKRYAKCIASLSDCFQLSTRYLSKQLPPQLANTPAHMIPPGLYEQYGTAGTAMEHHTLLGRLLRVAPCVYDPQVHAVLSKLFKTTKVNYETTIGGLRSKINVSTTNASEIILAVLKVGGEHKAAAMTWLTQALALNSEATKDRPSPLIAASSGFLINLNALFLALCQPIINDLDKLGKVQSSYLLRAEAKEVIPADSTRLAPSDLFDSFGGVSSVAPADEPLSFITQSFFMCWRSLHLGYARECNQYYDTLQRLSRFADGLETGEPRSVHFFVHKLCIDTQLLNPPLLNEVVKFCCAASQIMLHALTDAPTAAQTVADSSSWLVLPQSMAPQHRTFLLALPEDLLDDILTVLITVGHTEPVAFTTPMATNSLEPVLALIIFFLRRPWAVQSPHLRAKFGKVLYQVFLPASETKRDMWSPSIPVDGPHTSMLERQLEAQKFLAPTLLLLYGDVEKTGFYEKVSNRRSIMVVLKHLWQLPSHRAAFRGIAAVGSSATNVSADVQAFTASSFAQGDVSHMSVESASPTSVDHSQNYFIRFANGLMNETNTLVTSTMEKLSEIKKIQTVMKTPAEWAALGEEPQQQMREKLEECEQTVRGTAQLCQETIHMLNYLTSDEVIRLPFLIDEILPRFVSMLLSVLSKIVGSKSLEIKVDNMESYNFDPKSILKDICQAITHFASFPAFCDMLAQDGFYEDGVPLRKAISAVEKTQVLSSLEMTQLKDMYERSLLAKTSAQVKYSSFSMNMFQSITYSLSLVCH